MTYTNTFDPTNVEYLDTLFVKLPCAIAIASFITFITYQQNIIFSIFLCVNDKEYIRTKKKNEREKHAYEYSRIKIIDF